MKKDWGDYIADILNAIKEVEEFTEGMGFEAFLTDKKTINAVIRSLEVLGEAAKRIPEDIRERYLNIPWKRMAGMRDKLIHEYSGVDLEIVWTVIKEELPPIKPHVKKVLQDLQT
ncbi:MAG TPA: HepT-like ribonuclease domain-containing protein [Candidatus Brocadiia bacterium]|nr:DUF86 domain-containing protein [Candidatus Brocadiales bacterium]